MKTMLTLLSWLLAALALPSFAQNLADAEAPPTPVNTKAINDSVLKNFSKNRDAAASSKASASLGLVKAQQDMDNATREAEAKIRDAQNTRNAAGASALAQRQQDAASAASQQASGGIGNVLGDSLVQSIQQGAQSAAQAVGGAAAGHAGQVASGGSSSGGMASGGGGAIGQAAGGAVSTGASTAAGQIFGGESTTGGDPAAAGTGNPTPTATPAAVGSETGVASDMSAMRMSGKRYVGPPIRMAQPRPSFQGVFDAVCPRHGKYGGEIGKVKGCPRCESEKYQMWDAFCQLHGKYGGRGPVTGCPRCRDFAQQVEDRGAGQQMQEMAPANVRQPIRPGQTIHTPPPGHYSR